MTRMAIASMLRGYLRKVKEYIEKKEAAGDDKTKLPPYDLGLEHGIPVLKKEIPLKVHSYMHDMMTVLEIAKEFDIYVTLDHAQGSSDFYEELTDPLQGSGRPGCQHLRHDRRPCIRCGYAAVRDG